MIMTATFNIIHHSVGDQGQRFGDDVRRIQQLLRLSHYDAPTTGHWDSATRAAWQRFQEREHEEALLKKFMLDTAPKQVSLSVHPWSTDLVTLAERAGVLIHLHPGIRGRIGFELLHNWLTKQHVEFDWNSAVYGLTHSREWAIVVTGHEFNLQRPRSLNCTTYVNLMMGIWAAGNAHGAPFNAKVEGAGVSLELPKDRYGYPLVGDFADLHELTEHVRQQSNLYRLAYRYSFGDRPVGHYALLLDGRVYECNLFGITSSVRDVSLPHWWSSHPYVSLYGPSPSANAAHGKAG
jgi:hypothetical protein